VVVVPLVLQQLRVDDHRSWQRVLEDHLGGPNLIGLRGEVAVEDVESLLELLRYVIHLLHFKCVDLLVYRSGIPFNE
jgi:hypothetical protein